MEDIKNAEHTVTTLPYSPQVRFCNWATQQTKNPTKKPKENMEKRAEGHLLDLHGDLEFHIRGLLTYFKKWSNTEGFSVMQISVSLSILREVAREKQIYFEECYFATHGIYQ